MQVSGKTDISDIINQLPQNFTNDLGQDLGNGTSGLTTAGGVATADLRGLGPARTLVLIDGRRLGVGSPNTAIAEPAPDLDQIPVGLVERVEVVTGGASAAYGSDAIAGVVNFIMKKNFEGFQVDGQWGENYHDNNNTLRCRAWCRHFGTTPPTGTAKDGRNRTFDMLMGTNFADGKGNITAYLSYRHADPVESSQRDYGACQIVSDGRRRTAMSPASPAAVRRIRIGSNRPPGPTRAMCTASMDMASCRRARWRPRRRRSTTLRLHLHDARRRSLQRRVHGASRRSTDSFQPYAEFFFMDDKTHQQHRAGRAVQGQQSARSDGRGRLLRQLQQSPVERAATSHPVHAGADRSRYREPGFRERQGETSDAATSRAAIVPRTSNIPTTGRCSAPRATSRTPGAMTSMGSTSTRSSSTPTRNT